MWDNRSAKEKGVTRWAVTLHISFALIRRVFGVWIPLVVYAEFFHMKINFAYSLSRIQSQENSKHLDKSICNVTALAMRHKKILDFQKLHLTKRN